jgi:hypothetical protein
MRHRKILSILIFIFTAAPNLFADGDKVGTYNVGAGAGFVTGYGLSYRQWIGSYGFQVNFAPYYDASQSYSSTTISLGLTGLRMIKEAKYVNLFGYLGAHYFRDYATSTEYYYDYTTNMSGQMNYTSGEDLLFLGGGPGFDFHFWHLSFNLMFGIAYQTDFSGSAGVHFTGETALYYSF